MRRTLNAAIDSDRDRSFEFFGLRTVYDRYLLRHPSRREVIETPQYFFLRVACGLSTDVDEAVELLRPDVVTRLPAVEPDAVQLGHVAQSDVELLPARLARGQPRGASTSATPTSPSCRSSPAASAWPGTGSARRARLIQGTNGLSNGIVPWLQARSIRRSPRSTRAAAARVPPACTSSRGTPTSRSSWSCATTPATTLGAPTTSTSPTGSPTCSWSGWRRTGSGRCSIPSRCRT